MEVSRAQEPSIASPQEVLIGLGQFRPAPEAGKVGQKPWLPCRRPGRPCLSGKKQMNFESSQDRNPSGLQRPREGWSIGLASVLGLGTL